MLRWQASASFEDVKVHNQTDQQRERERETERERERERKREREREREKKKKNKRGGAEDREGWVPLRAIYRGFFDKDYGKWPFSNRSGIDFRTLSKIKKNTIFDFEWLNKC